MHMHKLQCSSSPSRVPTPTPTSSHPHSTFIYSDVAKGQGYRQRDHEFRIDVMEENVQGKVSFNLQGRTNSRQWTRGWESFHRLVPLHSNTNGRNTNSYSHKYIPQTIDSNKYVTEY